MKFGMCVLGIATVAVSGCAPMVSGAMNAGTSSEDVYSKTAAYFGTDASNIEFGEIDKGLLHTSYTVRYEDVFYNCRVYYGEVECISPTAQ